MLVFSFSVRTNQTNTTPVEPPFGFKLHGWLVPAWGHIRLFRHPFARDSHTRPHARWADRLAVSARGGIKRFLPRTMWTAKSAQDAGPRVQVPMRFLLALVVAALCTAIELPRLHHQGDEWLDKYPFLFRLEHERDHRCPPTSRPTASLSTSHLAQKKSVLCIVHKGSAVAARFVISFLEALQVRIVAAMAWKRLRQAKAGLTVLSIRPGGELRD